MRLAAVLVIAAACGSSKKPAPTTTPSEPIGGETMDGDSWGEHGTAAPSGPDEPPPGEAAPPPSAPSKPASGGGLDANAQAFVDAHNAYRAKHCAPPLSWSPALAKVAQNWANELKRQGCAFEHSNQQKYGENLAGGSRGALDPRATVAMWYDEVKLYNFASGGFSMETGHFTQVVWTTTTQLGCGWVTCGQMDIIVCNYDPPGNWQGQYKQHVLPTSCKK